MAQVRLEQARREQCGIISLAPHAIRRGGRVDEGGRLEICCGVLPHRGFESHPLRYYSVLGRIRDILIYP